MQAMRRNLRTVNRCAGAVVGSLLCALTVLAQGPSAAARPIVSDVIIQGNRQINTEQIKERLRTRAGNPYNEANVQEDVRDLLKTNQFSKAEAVYQADGPGRIKVYFLVREQQSKVDKVLFQGAKHFKNDELLDATGIRVGQPLNPYVNKAACPKIEAMYREKGRMFAQCKLLKGADVGDTEVVFNIVEGRKVLVSDIQFVGNTFVSGPVLATHIRSSTAWFHLLGGTYNPAMTQGDIDELIKYYRSFGFQDVRVSLETRFSADGSEVTLIFHINEGQRYRIKDVPDVIGAKSVPREQLVALSPIRPGDWYDQRKVDADLQRIKYYLGEMGHDVKAEAIPVWSKDQPGECTVQYQLMERPPARVGQIFIIGNDRTKMNVILRQVPFYPGQILSYPELEAAKMNLNRLGIFQPAKDGNEGVQVKVLDPESESVFKDILVEVQEANTGSLMFGVGVNSNSGFNGSIVLNERNFDLFAPPLTLDDLFSGRAFRGAGQELRISAMPGTQFQQYMITFREPFLFDTPFNLTNSLYYFTRFYNEYTEEREGGRITLGRQINRFWNVTAGMRIENVAVNNVSSLAPIDYQQAVGNNFQIGFRGGIMRDTRDNFLRPTSGSHLEFSYEEMTGEHTFPLINVVANKYFTVYQRADGSGRHVIAFNGNYGWAGTTTPVYERFFAGGFTTIRGFQFRGVGPDINGFKVGGDAMVLNSLEYQVPVKANDQIYLVGFVDSGSVGPRIDDLGTYRVSAGFGIRFTVPMLGPVPIALDFGFPIVKAPFDNTQVFNFWMGFTR